MIASFISTSFLKLNGWLEQIERNRDESYLASSADIGELEHRIRNLEQHSNRLF